jgi:prepilin-type processing-associated H-X9-DG protein
MVGNPGNLLKWGVNVNNTNYQQFLYDTDIQDPSMIYVFLDEHPDSINDGYFLNLGYSGEWVDLPASYHDNAGSFSFADGHTEIHRWKNPSTIAPPRPGIGLPIVLRADDDKTDFKWVVEHTSVDR